MPSRSELFQRVRHVSSEILLTNHVVDSDNFSDRIADCVAKKLVSGLRVGAAVNGCILATKTDLFRQPEINKSKFVDEFTAKIIGGDFPPRTLLEALTSFAKFAQSQLAWPQNKRDEEFLRSCLQSYLASVYKSFRENHEGRGKVDIFAFTPGDSSSESIVETKVPANVTEFRDGLTEVAEYATSRGVVDVFYVFVEQPTTLDEHVYQSNLVEMYDVNGVEIHSVRIQVAKETPSKAGKAIRKRKSTNSN